MELSLRRIAWRKTIQCILVTLNVTYTCTVHYRQYSAGLLTRNIHVVNDFETNRNEQSVSNTQRNVFYLIVLENTAHFSWFLKGRFTRYNFVVCDKLTTSLRHDSFRVNLTYNLLAIVAYDTKNVVGF